MKEFAVRELTLGQVFDASVEAFPLREAVVHPGSGVRWTWRELSERVDAAARGLMAIGVGGGEKIALWVPNCPQWIVFMFAAAKIGAVLITVNTNYQETELRYLLRQPGCETIAFFQGRHGRDLAASLSPREVEDYLAFCRGRIAWYKIPRHLAVVEAFPQTASGKVQKYKLREMAESRFAADAERFGRLPPEEGPGGRRECNQP